MGLFDAIEAAEALLTKTLAGLKLKVPQFRTGDQELVLEDAPPRVCWVPRGGPIGPTDALGGGTNASRLGDGAVLPGPLWSRHDLIEVHIWMAADPVPPGESQQRADIAACEKMGRHVVAAMHGVAYGSYKVVSSTWNTSSVSNLGVVWIIGIVLGVPFVREDEVLSLPIADYPITPVIINPSP